MQDVRSLTQHLHHETSLGGWDNERLADTIGLLGRAHLHMVWPGNCWAWTYSPVGAEKGKSRTCASATARCAQHPARAACLQQREAGEQLMGVTHNGQARMVHSQTAGMGAASLSIMHTLAPVPIQIRAKHGPGGVFQGWAWLGGCVSRAHTAQGAHVGHVKIAGHASVSRWVQSTAPPQLPTLSSFTKP